MRALRAFMNQPHSLAAATTKKRPLATIKSPAGFIKGPRAARRRPRQPADQRRPICSVRSRAGMMYHSS
jgi:hypothetical protein